MAERRYTFVFYVAVLVAAVAVFGVYRVLQVQEARGQIATRGVVVATMDIPEGMPIDRLAVTASPWPVPTIPPGAFSRTDSVVGRVARVAIFKGEPIVPGRLAPEGTGPGLAVKITPGKRAMAIKINDVAGISGLLQPNSRVDIMVTLRTNSKDGELVVERNVAKLFMDNMRVLSVGSQVQPGEASKQIAATTVTIEVTPTQAEQLAVATNQGTIQLVLRGYGDPDSIMTKGATSADVLANLRDPVSATERPAPPPPRRASAPAPRRIPEPAPVAVVQAPVAAPPPKPESLRVQIYRGAKVTEQRFRGDSAGRDSTRTP